MSVKRTFKTHGHQDQSGQDRTNLARRAVVTRHEQRLHAHKRDKAGAQTPERSQVTSSRATLPTSNAAPPACPHNLAATATCSDPGAKCRLGEFIPRRYQVLVWA